jgi:hypothetical protein
VLRAVVAAAPDGRPPVVRLRTAAVVPGTPLAEREAAGEFVLPDDVEVAQELRDLLAELGYARLELRSDHSLNLFPGLAGSLPGDRPRLLAMLDEYLGLPRDEQARYTVGARLGIYGQLTDRFDPARSAALERQLAGYRSPSADELLRAAAALRARFL